MREKEKLPQDFSTKACPLQILCLLTVYKVTLEPDHAMATHKQRQMCKALIDVPRTAVWNEHCLSLFSMCCILDFCCDYACHVAINFINMLPQCKE